MSKFKATHEITDSRGTRAIPVIESEGALYTRQEWDRETAADWEIVDGELRFQGGVPVCDEYAIKAL
jgi:hypothetical protein